MECRSGYSRTGKKHRLEDADRSQRSRSADIDLDIKKLRFFFFGRILVGFRPSGKLSRAAESLSVSKLIDFYNRSVDITGQISPVLIDALYLSQHIINIVTAVIIRCRKAQLGQIIQRLNMRYGIKALDRLDIEYENVQTSFCCDLRVLLSERSRSGIPRIFEGLFAVILLFGDDALKGRNGHIDLSPDLQKRRGVLQALRQTADRHQIIGDILACRAVAAGRAADKNPVPVFAGYRQTVKLRLYHIFGTVNDFTHPAVKIPDLIRRERIVQALHRYGMHNGRKLRSLAAADLLRRRIRRDKSGKCRLDLLELTQQHIIFIVTDLGIVLIIIPVVVIVYHVRELPCALACLFKLRHDFRTADVPFSLR